MKMHCTQQASWTWQKVVRNYVYTSAFCVFVAVLLWLIEVSPNLGFTMVVSFSIGLSVNTAFTVFTRLFERVLNPLVTSIVITAIGIVFGLSLGGWLLNGDASFFFSKNHNTLVLAICFGIAGSIYVTTRLALSDTNARLAEQDRLQVETELRLLQAQIEPHFLFNTLANISSLIRSDPEAAQSMLNSFTGFLRASLQRTRDNKSTLEDEMDIVRTYLDIQKIRLGDRLNFTIELEAGLASVPFPPLLLQPLVENAVVHGIEPAEIGGNVFVEVNASERFLIIRVSDTGVGLTQESHGTKMSISNIKQRIALLYGDTATLELSENKPTGLVALLNLPLP